MLFRAASYIGEAKNGETNSSGMRNIAVSMHKQSKNGYFRMTVEEMKHLPFTFSFRSFIMNIIKI